MHFNLLQILIIRVFVNLSVASCVKVLDLGSGAFDLGVDLMKRMKQSDENMHGTVLITHTHWDHIQGFPFFAPVSGTSMYKKEHR